MDAIMDVSMACVVGTLHLETLNATKYRLVYCELLHEAAYQRVFLCGKWRKSRCDTLLKIRA